MMPKNRLEQNEYFDKCDKEATRILDKFGIKSPRCGFSIGLGWMPVVERAIEKMISLGWDKDLHQVKQKFCGLRIYIGVGSVRYTGGIDKYGNKEWESSEIGKAIDEAEIECNRICEVCGQEREKKGFGKGWALCNGCGEAGKDDNVQPVIL